MVEKILDFLNDIKSDGKDFFIEAEAKPVIMTTLSLTQNKLAIFLLFMIVIISLLLSHCARAHIEHKSIVFIYQTKRKRIKNTFLCFQI